MSELLNGKETAALCRAEYRETVSAMEQKPGLAVIIVGRNPASQVYVRNKAKACADVGIESEVIEMPEETTQQALLEKIEQLNKDSRIDGILVQLPLPKHLSDRAVIAAIRPDKDVDCFHAENVGKLMIGEPSFLPCTPAGIMELLRRQHIDVKGKNCVVVGRSNIVGKPMAMLLLAENGTVTVCHSKTADLAAECRRADILVVAIGKAKFITADMVKEGAVVVDVGMNRDENGKLCGDVDFDAVAPHCTYITPVPGGVGPMTIAMLLKNTLKAASFHGKH